MTFDRDTSCLSFEFGAGKGPYLATMLCISLRSPEPFHFSPLSHVDRVPCVHAYMNGTAIRFAKKSCSQLPCCSFFRRKALREKRGPLVTMHHALDVLLSVSIDVKTIGMKPFRCLFHLFQIYIDMSPAQGGPLCGESHFAGAQCLIRLFRSTYVRSTFVVYCGERPVSKVPVQERE